MDEPIQIETLTGDAIDGALPALARLRIEGFSAFPYLYDGDPAYEQRYLEKLKDARDSIIVVALRGDEIVGCATGSALDESHAAFSAPLSAHGIDPASCFYCGESVLLPEARGLGIGHAFFDQRGRKPALVDIVGRVFALSSGRRTTHHVLSGIRHSTNSGYGGAIARWRAQLRTSTGRISGSQRKPRSRCRSGCRNSTRRLRQSVRRSVARGNAGQCGRRIRRPAVSRHRCVGRSPFPARRGIATRAPAAGRARS